MKISCTETDAMTIYSQKEQKLHYWFIPNLEGVSRWIPYPHQEFPFVSRYSSHMLQIHGLKIDQNVWTPVFLPFPPCNSSVHQNYHDMGTLQCLNWEKGNLRGNSRRESTFQNRKNEQRWKLNTSMSKKWGHKKLKIQKSCQKIRGNLV